MQDRRTATERYDFYNTLSGLVKSLENKSTVIDLRNESCVSGRIKIVDANMNIEMENVVFYDPRGQPHRFQEFFINCRNIRYVHVPKECSIKELIEQQITIMKPPKMGKQVASTFKKKRAQNYHKETVMANYPQPQPGSSKE